MLSVQLLIRQRAPGMPPPGLLQQAYASLQSNGLANSLGHRVSESDVYSDCHWQQ